LLLLDAGQRAAQGADALPGRRGEGVQLGPRCWQRQRRGGQPGSEREGVEFLRDGPRRCQAARPPLLRWRDTLLLGGGAQLLQVALARLQGCLQLALERLEALAQRLVALRVRASASRRLR